MSRLALLQIWDSMAVLFLVNLAFVAVLALCVTTVGMALAFGSLGALAAGLAACLVLSHFLLLAGALLDHWLGNKLDGWPGILLVAVRLLPAAAFFAGACFLTGVVAWFGLSSGGGALRFAQGIMTLWLIGLSLQIMIPAGVRVACGQELGAALDHELRKAVMRPVEALAGLALAVGLIATTIVGLPGIGGAFLALRSRAGLDHEHAGRSADNLTFLSVIMPWKR